MNQKTDAAGKTVQWDYNVRGQPSTRKWARKLSDGVTHLMTTYGYDSSTGELLTQAYNDNYETNPTPGVTYTYTRSGQLSTVADATGTRTFNYDSSTPWRPASISLPSFYNSRQLTEVYESASSSSGGSYSSYTIGTVKGRPVGFQLGTSGTPAQDLNQFCTYSNLGRLVGVNSAIGAGGYQNFIYSYVSGSDLLNGYTVGLNFSVARTYETHRDLVTQIKSLWSSTALTQFDFTYTNLGQRLTAKQSGTAYADYYPSGAGYSDVDNIRGYNARGELTSSVMYADASPSPYELPGRTYQYSYDSIGNRTLAGETGTGTSSGGLDDSYAANQLNQYTGKQNNIVRVVGTAALASHVGVVGAPSTAKVDAAWGADLVPPNQAEPAHGNAVSYATILGTGGAADKFTTGSKAYFVPPANQAFTYDADGNLTLDGIWNYAYDAENRLIEMTTTTEAVSYGGLANQTLFFTYDYLGRRVQKYHDNGGVESWRRFLYDCNNLVAEFNAPSGTSCGSTLRSYTWGLDLAGSLSAAGGVGGLLQMYDYGSSPPTTAKTFWPTYDGNGNVATLVNASSGAFGAVYEYDPFGNYIRAGVLDSTVQDNPFRFSTKYADTETGLVYYGNRFYSPSLGRFLNRDPIEEAGGLNLYGFCGNDAINRFDVNGNSWLSKLWDHTILSLGKHIAQNWDHGRQYVVAVVAVVAAILTYGELAPWAAGEVATAFGVSATSTVATVGGGMIAGAAAGFVAGTVGAGLSGANLEQTLHSGLMGAASGAILGGVSGYYGNAFPLNRVAVTAAASGLASAATGGSFTRGFEVGGAIGLLAYGWGQMRDFTDQVGQNAAANDPARLTHTADGSLDTAGTISFDKDSSLFGNTLDKFFSPFTTALDKLGMKGQGYQQQWYDTSLPAWLGGGEGGPIAEFVNMISKVHDFYEGWDYNVGAGTWISRGATFNGLYDVYGMAGMVPSALYTGVALSPAAPFAVQKMHQW